VSISTEEDPENFVKITPDDHQELKDIEDRTTDLILCLDSTCDTLTSFQEMYKQFCQRLDDIRSTHTLDAVAVALRDQVKEIQYTRRKVEALLSRIQSTRTLVSQVVACKLWSLLG